MNEMNPLEQQMRSWHPRRPSTTRKVRIFGVTQPAHTARWFWGSLAPSMACLWLTLLTINHGGDGLGQKSKISLGRGQHDCADFTPEQSLTTQNNLLGAVTFEWTNRSSFNSTVGFTPSTN